MDSEQNELASLFPNVAAQMRSALSNFHLAAAQLAPASAREQDPALDTRAAQLDQSYYQLLRLANSLSMASYLTHDNPLPLRDTDVAELVGELCERAAALAPMLGLELHFVCSMDRHICAVSPEAIEQILNHLLSNAFKFTPAGGSITVKLQCASDRLLLSVEDTGCGISPDRLETLFDRYLHSDRMDPPPHGLGLGLPLCRRLAAGQGGTLIAESREGKGTRFTLSLPERQLGTGVSDVHYDYSGGFNRTLLGLADALPSKAFLLRNQE